MISGRKITTAQNMICSVRWLDTASQTVRLLAGSLDDGMMNGNSAKPGGQHDAGDARRTTARTRAPARRRADATSASSAPPKAASGAAIVHGCFA